MIKKIEFTERAKKQIKKITAENKTKKYFRISVKGGGCSGFKYNFSFDNSTNENDVLFNNTVLYAIAKSLKLILKYEKMKNNILLRSETFSFRLYHICNFFSMHLTFI